jgi:hypothetical protein
MSNAVTATGTLVLRGPIVPPATVTITTNSIDAAGSVVTTSAPHGLTEGDEALIAGNTGSVPSINGLQPITEVLSATTFRIPVATTTGGTGGTIRPDFSVVGEITEVTPGGMARNKIETTTHNDGSESHVLGILRQGDPGLKINYVGSDPTHVAILADLANNVKNNWMIRFPSGVSRTGQAYVQQFAFDTATVDGKQGATMTLTWAGPVTEDAGV